MNRLALFLVLALSSSCSWALSDFQKFNHLHPEQKEVSPLELFASPLQVGVGKFMISPNWANVVRIVAPGLAKKMDGNRTLVDRWVDTQMACDEDLRKLWNDDRPYKNKAERLAAKVAMKALKEKKREEYKEKAIKMAAEMKK